LRWGASDRELFWGLISTYLSEPAAAPRLSRQAMIAREARMRQLATGDKLAIEELTNELLAGLGRPATAADRIAAEILATATVRQE
jgi:hypothetical protein